MKLPIALCSVQNDGMNVMTRRPDCVIETPLHGHESTPGGTLVWLMGRGLSIGCGLSWSVPAQWERLDRAMRIERIKASLLTEMDKPEIDTSAIRSLLVLLRDQTARDWRHRFVTTNWDTLLQREIDRLNFDSTPDWLPNTGVAHLNGVVEDANEFRSPFLLETDSAEFRTPTAEANKAFNQIIWMRHFVLVGMSFECRVDKGFLRAIAKVEDDLPIGESEWVVVNPNDRDLAVSCQRIQEALPNAHVQPVARDFHTWLLDGLPELQEWGVLCPRIG